MKKSIILLCVLIISALFHKAIGQQDALFTQYIDAQLYSNAAYAGSNDYLSVAAIHRQQWAGFQGAPMTTGLIVHTPLQYESIGVGLEIWNDRIGTLNRTTVGGNFAYRFRFKSGGKLALGIKGIIDLNSSDISQLSNGDNDPRAQSLTNSLTPNAGIGILYKSSKWFMGIGVPRLLGNNNSETNGGYSNDMHAYVLAGVLVNLKNNWIFRPSTQVRGALNAPMSVDISATFINNKVFHIGLNYRLLASAGLIAQYQITRQFKLGYAFDLGLTSALRTTNFGSHEVMLSYDMNYTKSSVASPRFF
jgi:type IX secretion system PorP/SprF family membrane protein